MGRYKQHSKLKGLSYTVCVDVLNRNRKASQRGLVIREAWKLHQPGHRMHIYFVLHLYSSCTDMPVNSRACLSDFWARVPEVTADQ